MKRYRFFPLHFSLIVSFFCCLLTSTVSGQTTTTYAKLFTVAQDGSGDFKTIQDAVNAVRDLSQQQVTIRIKKGIYHEKVVIPSWKTKVYLLGEDKDQTIITNSDFRARLILMVKMLLGKISFLPILPIPFWHRVMISGRKT